MRIVCVGGGPAGLYFAIAAKRRDAGHDITVIERDPPGATYGWGIACRDSRNCLLDVLYHHDAQSARQVRAAAVLWQGRQVRLRGEQTGYLGHFGFGLSRATLLDILARRATELGVDVQHRRQVDDLSAFADADLVVASDGANSRTRQLYGEHFGTRVTVGRNRYIWLGTDKVFTDFTFAFEETPAGWIWLYAYPSSTGFSTCVVECSPETWEGLGFGSGDSADSVGQLEKIFEHVLDGHGLISQSRGEPARWLRFTQVYNQTWYHNNVVLMGDAAHTTHFTLGAGTKLAISDAVDLAQSLFKHSELSVALRAYDQRRRAALHPRQGASRTSMAWFEQVDRYLDHDVVDFSYAFSTRRGNQQPWRYQKHLASQIPALRAVQRRFNSGRRWYLAVRRGESALIPTKRTP
ncbi:MAG TPA: FAD-dependent monooxygenase [Kineosporiaceae bacterium]